MDFSDSMFLFEIVVSGLKNYTRCEKIQIVGQFADIFKINLNNPTVKPYNKKLRTNKGIQRHQFKKIQKSKSKNNTHTGQFILIISKSSELLPLMKKYPFEILIMKGNDLYQKLGSSIIPWSNECITYLTKDINSVLRPAYTEGEYNVYDELTSKKIATININIKLTHLRDKVNLSLGRFMSIPNKPDSLMNTGPYKMISSVDASVNPAVSLLKKEIHSSVNVEQITNKPLLEFESCKKNTLSQVKDCSCIKSDLDITRNHNKPVISVMSCSSLNYEQKKYLYRYIFGDLKGPFGIKVYQVGYFTVETDVSGQSSPKAISSGQSSENPTEGKKRLTFGNVNSESSNLTDEAAHFIQEIKCEDVTCNNKKYRELPPALDDRILLDLTNMNTDCCAEVKEKVEEVVGGVIAKMKIGHDPCFCSCECGLFTYSRKTTYCTVCGGYEQAGDDIANKSVHEIPMPCPIFHKLVDKNKLKTLSTSGSESKKKGDDHKSIKGSSGQKATTDKRSTITEKKSVESEKGKKKKKDDRFKFNYGYKGIPPQIGHSNCALPCTGTLDNVPKRMGWLWSAENIPGMKFRPLWKPGAINKHVLRLLRIARHPDQVISKKKRKDAGKKKRPLKRPLLVVHKKDGEYTVTMETMKSYSKPRAINQHPYEDKPVLTYTIGRSEEENRERLKRKEREQRRLETAQRHFIQSAFRDMCHEICLKTYQQALGILPTAEDPECICYPALPTAKHTNMELSCSCSEDKLSPIGSDTDSDEWLVEFTPPNATFDPNYKGKRVIKTDNGSQYSYLDYRVKLVDRFGNPVPRFFRGPDGKQECSDLGGFWSPEHKWLEINVDGYIGPDGKWAPINFIGPNGEQVEAESGKFQAMNGKWLVVGVDGFVDSQGKWKYYPKAVGSIKKRYRGATDGRKARKSDKIFQKSGYKSETWSCFGDVSPKQLSELGIVGHGDDRKLLLMELQKLLERGEDVKLPKPSTVYHLPSKKTTRKGRNRVPFSQSLEDRYKCKHPVPSDKGIVAVDDHGNKTYFRLRDYKNRRPKDRMALLTDQGISLSSFHVPCFNSFINSEVMKQQQRDRRIALCQKNVATQLQIMTAMAYC